MSRIANAAAWRAANVVDHPPLMVHQLCKAVLGGTRWNQCVAMAEMKVLEGLRSGAVSATRDQKQALGLPTKGRQRSGSKVTARKPIEEDIMPPQPSSSLVRVDNALAVPDADSLRPRPRIASYDVLDCTFGHGVHASAIIGEGAPYARVVGVDCDLSCATKAKEVADEFGHETCRFFGNPMSQCHAMFGDGAFDCVLVDPGPNAEQLTDPGRGFSVEETAAPHMDMRYGPFQHSGALDFLNSCSNDDIFVLARDVCGFKPQFCRRVARTVISRRPFKCAGDVYGLAQGIGGGLPDDMWLATTPFNNLPMSMRFLIGLRTAVNAEVKEFQAGVSNAMRLLKPRGRLVVFTRLPHEWKVVKALCEQHPFAIELYRVNVEKEECEEFGHNERTVMWVIERASTATQKRDVTEPPTLQEVRKSAFDRMAGISESRPYGYPAQNFTSATLANADEAERRVIRDNEDPEPLQ